MTEGLFSSKSNELATPAQTFNQLDEEFHFNLDPCSTHENAKCERHFTIKEDGLKQDWGGKSVLQSSLRQGITKVGTQMLRGKQKRCTRCHAYPGAHGHCVVLGIYLRQGKGNPLHPWSSSFQRFKTGSTVPVNGSSILIWQFNYTTETAS